MIPPFLKQLPLFYQPILWEKYEHALFWKFWKLNLLLLKRGGGVSNYAYRITYKIFIPISFHSRRRKNGKFDFFLYFCFCYIFLLILLLLLLLLLLLFIIIIIVIIIIVVTCFSNSVIWIEKISESLVWNWEILIEVNQMLL